MVNCPSTNQNIQNCMKYMVVFYLDALSKLDDMLEIKSGNFVLYYIGVCVLKTISLKNAKSCQANLNRTDHCESVFTLAQDVVFGNQSCLIY